MLSNYFFVFENLSLYALIDILLISIVFYTIYNKVSRTRILPILQSFLLIILLTFLSSLLGLTTTHYILQNVVSLMFIAAIILFPAEIKRGLNRIGDTFFHKFMFESLSDNVVENIIKAVVTMAKNKTGAIIVLQGNDDLGEIIDSGVRLNAHVEKKLLLTIFNKESLLHDGAVVIFRNSIKAASCFVPHLSSSVDKQNNFGSRHLAALGLSEETDAFIIVVSEENGKISVAKGNQLIFPVSKIRLIKMIKEYFDVNYHSKNN